jgi:hypothetical protein
MWRNYNFHNNKILVCKLHRKCDCVECEDFELEWEYMESWEEGLFEGLDGEKKD